MPIFCATVTGILSFLLASAEVFAQSTPAEFNALVSAKKAAEIETLARERTARNPKDDVAWWFLARAVADDAVKREQLLPGIETCVKDLPQSARCHHALGVLYGALATSSGLTAGIKYASRIKESFVRAVELAPQEFEMRRDLIQFYLQAPGLAGGSVRRAIENADAFAQFDPSRSKLLRADVHVYEKEWDRAEALLATIKPAGDASASDLLAQAQATLGFALIGAKETVRARKVFERALSTTPNEAILHMGLGRTLLEQNELDAAIASLERAVAIDAKVGAHYRLGIAYETKGDKQKAAAAFSQFLTYRSAGPGADDAKKRLAALKQG